MKVKAIGMMLALAMLLGLAAMPAAANTGAGAHAGVFQGDASVGKGAAECNNDGTGSVSGGGIGLPIVHGLKTAHWRIDVGTAVDVPNGVGSGQLCGDLNATPVDPSLGASCVSTSGANGQGKVSFANGDIWVTNLGWITTVGGTFVVTGNAAGAKGKTTDQLRAVVQALDELVVVGCVLKDKANTQTFRVVATYTVTPA